MLQTIVVMLEGTAGVVRRVYEDALDLASKFLFESFEGEQIIAKNKAVIEHVVGRHPMRRVIRLLRVLEKDTRFELRAVFLSNPGELKFLLPIHKALIGSAACNAE